MLTALSGVAAASCLGLLLVLLLLVAP